MSDQAESLRSKMRERSMDNGGLPAKTRVIAVASGKGGVGKSNFCVNFALALKAKGKTPLIVDADVGFSNIELLLNTRPFHTVLDLAKDVQLFDVISTSPHGLSFLSGGSGLHSDMLDDAAMVRVKEQLANLSNHFDTVIIDLGAGINHQSAQWIAGSDELILLATPEPTAISDAYAFLKLLYEERPLDELPAVRLVINRALKLTDAREASERLSAAALKFLEWKLETLGFILEDDFVSQAVMRQVPVLISFPNSTASRCMEQIAANFLRLNEPNRGGWRGFLHRFWPGKSFFSTG
ncbi:MinD/ParA family protein [Alicyclobacillus sp. TC]|uniref:Flagellar biosynthesis protein FlhG n=1 Tax=Alicyclobacillus tolerans TaxID=90970 RepID=A0A1M6RN55_9BACL|nr:MULTISPECIES: P-loop NTPase [Alicyclobacillus]QRF23702.1 MinD/ParA family protein [Alicyclobacillus sp. TC]SHK33758.1 flagellar biosynthesis protein FlhG [Alicyclobacillus montanus]